MKILDLIDLPALVACHGRSLVVDQRELAPEAVAATWSAARSRLDAWDYDLGIYRKAAAHEPPRLGDRLVRVVLEIEASDVLTRSVAALFAAHDAYHRRWRVTPIGNNMLAGQRIAVGRATSLLGQVAASHETVQRVTRLRDTRLELAELSDTFVSAFAPFANISAYAHNSALATRLGQVAADRVAHGDEPLDAIEQTLKLRAMASQLNEPTINAELNQQLAEGILGLFGPELFDSFGLLRGTWLRRMEQTGREAEALLDEWLGTAEVVATRR